MNLIKKTIQPQVVGHKEMCTYHAMAVQQHWQTTPSNLLPPGKFGHSPVYSGQIH